MDEFNNMSKEELIDLLVIYKFCQDFVKATDNFESHQNDDKYAKKLLELKKELKYMVKTLK